MAKCPAIMHTHVDECINPYILLFGFLCAGIWLSLVKKRHPTLSIMAAPPVGVFVVFPVAVAVRTIVQM